MVIMLDLMILTFMASCSHEQNDSIEFSYHDQTFNIGTTKTIQSCLDSTCFFEGGKYFSPNDQFDSLVTFLNQRPNIFIELGCHTGVTGTEDQNLKMSEKCAKFYCEKLILSGIEKSRLVARGYGEMNPIVEEEKIKAMQRKQQRIEAESLNARIVLKITQL